MRKPRPFNHQPIYSDSRKERLQQVEQRARHELGLSPSSAYSPADLHGVFASVHHRHKGVMSWLNIPMVLSVVLILAAIAFLSAFLH